MERASWLALESPTAKVSSGDPPGGPTCTSSSPDRIAENGEENPGDSRSMGDCMPSCMAAPSPEAPGAPMVSPPPKSSPGAEVQPSTSAPWANVSTSGSDTRNPSWRQPLSPRGPSRSPLAEGGIRGDTRPDDKPNQAKLPDPLPPPVVGLGHQTRRRRRTHVPPEASSVATRGRHLMGRPRVGQGDDQQSCPPIPPKKQPMAHPEQRIALGLRQPCSKTVPARHPPFELRQLRAPDASAQPTY